MQQLTTHYLHQISDNEDDDIPQYSDMITESLSDWLVDGAEDLDDKVENITYFKLAF